MSALRRREAMPFLLIVAAALIVRLLDLGDRPFHHDESQDAYFSWVLYDRHDYEYDPLLHGPLRFYMTAAMYLVFGDSDFTARLAPALMGTAIVGLPYLLREQIGRAAALVATLMLAFGPTYLYFSRFAREDIYIACITLGMLVVAFRFLHRPRRHHPALLMVLLALSFATKESTWITGFVGFTFLVPALIVQKVRGKQEIVGAVRQVGGSAWAFAAAAFLFVYTLTYTVFFTDPDGIKGLYTGLDYWLGQHEVGRGGEPWYFYFAVLFGHEWPVILLGLVGAVAAFRRPTTLNLFLVWMFVASLAIYSWAGEKFSWLALHPLLPLILLAGIGVQWLWDARRRWGGRIGLAFAVLVALYLPIASWWANVEHRADPKEFLVSTQSSEDVLDVRDRVYSVDDRFKRRTGQPVTIHIDSAEGATYPWAWYFRDRSVFYVDMQQPGYAPGAQVLIMTPTAQQRLLPELAAYDGTEFRFRVWWVRDWKRKFEPGAWGPWLTRRETWNPIGGLPEWVYVRKDAAAS